MTDHSKGDSIKKKSNKQTEGPVPLYYTPASCKRYNYLKKYIRIPMVVVTACPFKEQTAQLSKFMVKQFVRGVKYKYIDLLIPNDNIGEDTTSIFDAINDNKLSAFFETMLKRSQAHNLQFKRICCIIIKFLECCEAEVNYMKYLKFNLNKLIVSAFIMSVVNTGISEGEKIIQREQCYNLYSKITGLSVKELANCCSVVRPVVVRRSRRQQLLLRRNQGHTGGRRDSSPGDRPNLITSTTSLHQTHGTTHSNSLSTSPERENFFHDNMAPMHPSINPSLVLTANSNTSDTTNTSNNIPNDLQELYRNFMFPSSNEQQQQQQQQLATTSNMSITTNIYERVSNNNSTIIFQDDPQYKDTTHNKYNQRGNGYILPSEIEQFNLMGQRLVKDNFKIV